MYDVVIIGSGLAGLTCALEISRQKKVLILTKNELVDCNSFLAQGGIAATTEIEDVALHVNDTLVAGCNLNDIEVSNHIIKSGKRAIDFLSSNHVEFDQVLGKIHLTKEAAHSKRRIFHAGGDQTGKKIMQELLKEVKSRKNIEVLTNARALEFVDKKLIFAVNKQLKSICSDSFVLALGGINHLYSVSTAAKTNIGDFVHLANSVDLELDGMQYVQFHPTAFYDENASPNFLISEALRGEGAVLKNHCGEEFMGKYHELKSLAPRDVVARAIISEMNKTKTKYMYLDIRNRGKEFYLNHFPQIYQHLKNHNIDMNNELIPICPAAHYTIGGVKVNQFGQTNKKGFYASGECASSGFHGANRLASNSLLECVVLSLEIAKQINETDNNVYKIEELNCKLEVLNDEKIMKYREQFQNYLSVVRDMKTVSDLNAKYVRRYQQIVNQKLIEKSFDEISALSTGIALTAAIIKNPISIGSNYIKEKNE